MEVPGEVMYDDEKQWELLLLLLTRELPRELSSLKRVKPSTPPRRSHGKPNAAVLELFSELPH